MVAMSRRKSIVLHGLLVQISCIKQRPLIEAGSRIMHQMHTLQRALCGQDAEVLWKKIGKHIITYGTVMHKEMWSWYFLPWEGLTLQQLVLVVGR